MRCLQMDAVLSLLGSVKFGGKPLTAMQQRALAAVVTGQQYDMHQVVVKPHPHEADSEGMYIIVVVGQVLLQAPGEPVSRVMMSPCITALDDLCGDVWCTQRPWSVPTEVSCRFT
jgi:hypothetical protein